MEHKQHHHTGSGQGFLLGVIVGVVIALLFTTKKGREVFKTLTERGMDKFSDLEKQLQEVRESFGEEDDEELVSAVPESKILPESAKEIRHLAHEHKEEVHEHKHEEKEHSASPSRKFFKVKK